MGSATSRTIFVSWDESVGAEGYTVYRSDSPDGRYEKAGDNPHQGGPEPGRAFTAVTGEGVDLHGGGLYEHDSLSHGASFRGTDSVTLAVVLPLLLVSAMLYSRGSIRGALLLLGSIAYVLYNSFSLAAGAMYNQLFLVYVATVAVSFSAFVALYRELSCAISVSVISDSVPYAGSGVVRRRPETLPAAIALVMLIFLVGLVVIGQTLFQRAAGILYSTPQIAGFIGSWVVLGVIALFLLVRLLRSISPATGKTQG
jgi:hypothetical protein